ncbi:uncharacterized protein Z520_03942 [Fonsecaea multimorphosa CBS 102226]|uniref:Deacetylase sirtuin-type domain-containing protein n=1 Tax=Fonsecaea multimorphosa CBS 102226 TaxID=1442371 RepID=A0A0D2ITF8_9EURO|nr:uncharacterized protein Z520_03942 [Fonsecaea multimorphosa CBS 102226]KIY00257.1 hypothetical protein Z520_03942 [Fonsecaea multimorphosa CBS 102226]OAL27093.1 hypothetical protein AYO22_03724 [Fonsecaea multimorphosa]
MGLREVTCEDERALQEIADSLAGSHKILLVTGAGISTSCGIPDFRSKDGLYNMIPGQTMLPTPPPSEPSTPTHARFKDLTGDEEPSSSQSRSRRVSSSPSSRLRGQDLFDSRVFQHAESTTIFYQFIASLRQKIRDEVRSTSSVHKFVRVLRDGGRLMRCYTQNIDGLELREGLVADLARGKGNKRRFMKKHYEAPRPAHTAGTDFDGGCEVVQLHGDLEKLRCTMCSTQYPWTDEQTEVYLEGTAADCPKCRDKSDERQASGKRGLAVGALRPNIVLYGEDHPSNTLLTPLIPFDASCQPDVLVIMGTSLKVFGLQKIVREFAKAVHSHKNGKGRVIFVNRTRPAESVWDGIIDDFVAMDCDDWVDDLRRRRHDLWLRQGEIDLTVTKSQQPKRKRKSMEECTGKENRPQKKAKIIVDIPSPEKARHTPSSTPKKNRPVPKTAKLPSDYPGRAILSPLAQAKRPQISPFTSPIRRMDDDGLLSPVKRSTPCRPPFSPLTPGPSPTRAGGIHDHMDLSDLQRGTPTRPAFSPFTPGVRSGSKLKTEVFTGDHVDNQTLPSSPPVSGSQTESLLEENDTIVVGSKRASALAAGSRDSNFMAQIWQRVRYGRVLYHGRDPDSIQAPAEDDVAEVETPSKGPRGRKVDVFAD